MFLSFGKTPSLHLKTLLGLPHASTEHPPRVPHWKQSRHTTAFRVLRPPPYLVSLLHQPPGKTLEKGHQDSGVLLPLASHNLLPLLLPPTPHRSSCPHPLTAWRRLLFHAIIHPMFYFLYVIYSFSTTSASHLNLKSSRDKRTINSYLRVADSVKI